MTARAASSKAASDPAIDLDLRINAARLARARDVRFHSAVIAAIRRKDSEAARLGIAMDIGGAAEFILQQGGLSD